MDLTKIDQPFGELSQDVQDALVRAHENGAEMEMLSSGAWCWVDPGWIATTTYRLKPDDETDELAALREGQLDLVRRFDQLEARLNLKQCEETAEPSKGTPDQVRWDVLPPLWQWYARNSDGNCYVFSSKPIFLDGEWRGSFSEVRLVYDGLGLFTPSTCDWRDSLQRRPG